MTLKKAVSAKKHHLHDDIKETGIETGMTEYCQHWFDPVIYTQSVKLQKIQDFYRSALFYVWMCGLPTKFIQSKVE